MLNNHQFISLLIGIIISITVSAQPIKKVNGLSLVSSHKHLDEATVKTLKNSNANFIAVSPFGFSYGLDNPEIQYNLDKQWYGETKLGMKQYVGLLKKKFKVMIKPQLWVQHGEYTGFIKMKSEADWLLFEKSYSKFILDFAKVAEELHVALFCVGTELKTVVKQRPQYWATLIKAIRAFYHGKITYAANWDEFKSITIWGNLDLIGIDAYFPLSDKKSPTIKELENGWAYPKDSIVAVMKKYRKPILFTEYGCRSIDYATKEPWNSNKEDEKVNLQIQQNALQAIYNQFWNEKWFAGGFLWKWFPDSDAGGSNDNGFTPQNKPAEKLIQELYRN